MDSIVIKRPRLQKYRLQHLCLYKGYDFPEIEWEVVAKRRYVPHIRHKCEKKKIGYKRRKRRWVVERTNSWHNRFRKLLIRYEKKSDNYLGLVQLASTVGNGPRVGRYVVNLDGCNFASKRLISAIENSDVIICDELGPMEFKSKEFIACTKDLLETDKIVIIVVHKRLQHPIIDKFKKRASFIINVDLQNRDRVHHLLLDRL